MRILVIEDQADLARHVRRALTRADHQVSVAPDGPSGVEVALRQRFDLLVLDINLPGFDGYEVMRRLGNHEMRPRVLMLTCRSEIADRVAGLTAGADDYLTKPFAMEELVARVNVIGRRVVLGQEHRLVETGPLTLDVVRRVLLRDGKTIELSPREFELLEILMREPGRTFSRSELVERIWARPHAYQSKTLEILILRLRRKLDTPGDASHIETVRGFGYAFNAMAKTEPSTV